MPGSTRNLAGILANLILRCFIQCLLFAKPLAMTIGDSLVRVDGDQHRVGKNTITAKANRVDAQTDPAVNGLVHAH